MVNWKYHVCTTLWRIAAAFPLWWHYFWADVLLFPLLYHVLRYRRKLVAQHLCDCFPEKTVAERQRIARNFYHWLADLVVEIIKERDFSFEEMRKRMHFVNLAEILQAAEQDEHRHYFIYLGHFGNWEWVASLPLHSEGSLHFGQIYHALHNPIFDEMLLELRARFGAENIEMNQTLRTLLSLHKAGKRTMVGFISDQVPRMEAMFHWNEFLNHETSFFTGAEKIGKKLNARFFYLDMERPRRGYYTGTLCELQPDFNSTSPFPITDAYVAAFEASIRRHPELWLWTHNRWKRTRKDWEHYHATREERLHANRS